MNDDLVVILNYIDAQEARSTDAERQRRSREKRRDALRHAIRSDADTDVTERDAGDRERDSNVTPCHTVSQAVTPRLDQPRLDKREQRSAAQNANARDRAARAFRDSAEWVLAGMTKRSGVRRRATEANCKRIHARYSELLKDPECGEHRLALFELRLVAMYLWEPDGANWSGSEKMRKHLNPKTVYERAKFGDYLDEARDWYRRIGPFEGDPRGGPSDAQSGSSREENASGGGEVRDEKTSHHGPENGAGEVVTLDPSLSPLEAVAAWSAQQARKGA